MTSSVLSNLLHAPTIPSQLTQMEMDEMREGGLSKEQEEPMETEVGGFINHKWEMVYTGRAQKFKQLAKILIWLHWNIK